MSDIFISYARSTAKQAQAVAEALRSLGYGVWRDDDLPAHRAYAEVIQERLLQAKAVVVIWSAEAAKSEWVQSEADRARSDRKLVQMRIDEAPLPMPFDRVQCANLAGWAGEADAHEWRKVVASIKDLAGEPRSGLLLAQANAGAEKLAEPLLAVLAFDNLSGDPEMAYFSDGISEEILQTVARAAGLKVIGRGSSFQFRGADKAAAHIGAALKATHVLDGSVRRSGSKVRIAANLIECIRETTLWSDRFDRELSDVFALQDEIAAAVAAALKTALAPPAQRDAINPEAFTRYLKALDIRNRGLESDTRLAVIRLLEEATNLAPGFARAWVFLATMQAARLRFDVLEEADSALRSKVVAAAEAALRLDPNLGGAYQALAQLESFGRYAERETLHGRALSVAANDPTVLTNASLFFTELGWIRDALGYAKRAYDLDPMYPWVANWYAQMLGYAGRLEEGRVLCEKLCALWPENELIVANTLSYAAAREDWVRFDQLVAAAGQQILDTQILRRLISESKWRRDLAPEIQSHALKQIRDALAKTGSLPNITFTHLYRIGAADEVFELVDQISFDFMFDPAHHSPSGHASNGVIFSASYNSRMMRDPRFPRLCAKLGLCDYWVRTDKWPDCAEDGVLPYDFKAECRRRVAMGSQQSPADEMGSPSAS